METHPSTGSPAGGPPAADGPDGPGGAPGTRTARVPKYYRLKRHLLEITQTMPPGTPVPPERTLAAEFDTSRTTVRQALQELVVEGRLERIQGKGTFVAKPKVAQALQLTSYTEDMRAQGLEPTSQLLDIGYVTADDRLAGLLDIRTGGRVLRIERLRLANGEPMAIETTHLSAKRFPALRRNLAKYTSLYTALAEVYDVRLAEAEETIETSLATPREAGAAGHRRRAADAAAVPALPRHHRRTGRMGALGLPRRPLQVRGPAQAPATDPRPPAAGCLPDLAAG